MKVPPTTECEHCGGQIGHDDYVVCHDGITKKIVTFHKHCQHVQQDPALQRHHVVGVGGLGTPRAE